jgi:hypothetical protein
MATKYYQDDSTSTFSPQLMKSIQETNKNNAGTHIAKMFDDLGNVQEYKVKKQEEAQDKAVTREIAGINLEAIKQEVADKRNASKAMFENKPLSELGLEIKNPQYLSLVDDFLNKKKTLLSETDIKNTMAEASAKYTDENGFRYNDAVAHLKRKVDNGELSIETFAGTLDAVNKTQKRGIYEEKQSAKDELALIKTQLQIKKLSQDINNPNGGNGGSTNEIKNYKAYKESMIADGKTPKPYYSWIEDKDLNKNMGMGIKDMTYVDGLVNKALESGDPIEKANAANKYRNINKDASEADKYFRGLQPTTFQLDEAQKLVQKGGAGAGDEIKNQFSVWTGLDWDNTTQEGRTAFLSVLQPLAKASMTGTASDRDMKTLESSFATLYQSDKAVANALKNKAKALLFTAKTYQQAHPTYAELRGYDRSINMLEKIADDKPTSKTEEKDKKINIIYDGRNPNSPDPKQQEQPQTINKPSWKDYE